MGGRSRPILLSLIFICATLSGCLGEKESVEELDGDDILEWWIFRTKEREWQELDDDHVIEMNDGDSVFFEYNALMPADYLLGDTFSMTIKCSDGIYAENGMPIPLNEEDTLSFTMRDGNGKIVYDEDEIPCDNENYGKWASTIDTEDFDSRYWVFINRYVSGPGAYHSEDEAYETFGNDPEVPDLESVYPITIEIIAQTAGEIPGVSEDNSLELTLSYIEYSRVDPEAHLFGNYTVDECESKLGHEH